MLPLFTDGKDFAADFMTDNTGPGGHIIWHLFMIGTLIGLFP